MEDFVPFGSRTYALLFLLLLFSRGMDFLSTWVATPNMVLEGNPIAKKLGWKWGIAVNLVLCFLFAFWPLPAMVISTTSLLVAARNFQSAWLMRSHGRAGLPRLVCRADPGDPDHALPVLPARANTLLTAAVGAGVIYFSQELAWSRWRSGWA